MKTKITITFVFLFLLSNGFCQSIEIISDLRPGNDSGYLDASCIQDGELHFIGEDGGPSFHEVFSLDTEGGIQKIAMSPDVRGAEIIHCTNQRTYIYNREAPFIRDLYRYSSNSLTKVHSFDNDIVQSFEFDNGVVFIEEDSDMNKTVSYFSDDSNQRFVIAENINLGQHDFDVTSTNNFVLLSPLDDEYFDEGVIIYNSSSKQIDTDLLGDECEVVRYAYGFDDHVVYSCDGNYFIKNHIANQAVMLEIDGDDPLRVIETNVVFLETDNHIFIEPQLGDDEFFAISKQDLSIELLSDHVGGKVSLYEENGLIYFMEIDAAGKFHLFESDGSIESRKEIVYGEEKFSIRRGAILDGRVHFIISQGTGFQNDFLVRINENNELEVLHQLFYSSYSPLLERIGNKLVFPHNENGSGIELYSLSYIDTSTDDHNHEKINLYPNPSRGYIKIPDLDEEIEEIYVISMLGQKIPLEKFDSEIRVNGNGNGYYNIIIQTLNSVYSSKILFMGK